MDDGRASKPAAAGWYPDPYGRHEQRHWNGVAWTSLVANGRQVAVESAPVTEASAGVRRQAGGGTRRILWMVYAVPMTVALAVSGLAGVANYGLILGVVDLAISLPALVVMYLHIYDRERFNPRVRWLYAATFLVWQFVANLLIAPSRGDALDWADLGGLALCIPWYVAVVRYAARKWDRTPQANASVPVVYRPVDSERVRSVAKAQRMMLLCYLANLTANFLILGTRADLGPFAAPAALASAVFCIWCVYRLCKALEVGTVMSVVSMCVMIVPVIGFIFLALLNRDATRFLKKNGVKVGLLGARV